MGKLPATTKHAATVARVSVPTGLAFLATLFPEWAPAFAIATPLAAGATEYAIERPTRFLRAALQRGEVKDLSSEQAAAFVPMGYRFFLAARQGEYEHNLKLLAAFLTAELKSDTCQPGSFVDMARRVEGLTITSLRAVALTGDWLSRPLKPGRGGGKSVTAPLLANPKMFPAPMELEEAADALADLAGRGLLYPHTSGLGGGDAVFYATTQPLHVLISRALNIAKAEADGTAA